MVRLATGVAGGMLAEGGRRLASGESPKASELLITPGNLRRVTDQLASLRGAAMKVGQLLSMDAGDLLPAELADILARLRQDAQPMPHSQARKTLNKAWGKNWEGNLQHFDWLPIAAASIGQVHRVVDSNAEQLAVKVQYPGISRSIDSDVDNVATLLRISRLLPEAIDIGGLLDEAKRQLHQETDYLREAKYISRFRDLLSGDARFHVPEVNAQLTRRTVLAMSLAGGVPVESLDGYPQSLRDTVATRLVELAFRELFDFRLVQTDPNFANFRYDQAHDQLILLDFGATRRYPKPIGDAYRRLFRAARDTDRDGISKAAHHIGYFADGIEADQLETVIGLFVMATEPLRHAGPYDFAASGLAMRLADAGMKLSMEQDYWHTPPANSLFLHRKLGGLYLLAARLNARVDIGALMAPYIQS